MFDEQRRQADKMIDEQPFRVHPETIKTGSGNKDRFLERISSRNQSLQIQMWIYELYRGHNVQFVRYVDISYSIDDLNRQCLTNSIFETGIYFK